MMKPLGNKILLAEMVQKNTSAAGLIVRSAVDSKTGKVLAVGPDAKFVSVGDVILLDWSKGVVVTDEGAQRVLVSEDHVIAILEE